MNIQFKVIYLCVILQNQFDNFPLCTDDGEEMGQKFHNEKHYNKMNQRRYQQSHIIGHHQTQGDHSDEMDEFSGGLQDLSDNDLDDEEENDEEEEEEEDIDEEECPVYDNDSINCDEEDPGLCSPSDFEEKSSPSPNFSQATRSCGVLNEDNDGKPRIKNKRKSQSPEGKNANTSRHTTKNQVPAADQNDTIKDPNKKQAGDEKYLKSNDSKQNNYNERAKSLPLEASGRKQSPSTFNNQSELKRRKRKSRPSSSSSMLDNKCDKEHFKENNGSKCSFEHSTDGSKTKRKREYEISDVHQSANEGLNESKNNEKPSVPLKEHPKRAIATQIESITNQTVPSNKISNSNTDARNVWWTNADNNASTLSVETSGVDQASSVGSTPMISPEISIGQWQTAQCGSPSPSVCCSNVQAAALAAAAAASNSAITPPPGPSTAMAELANLVNAHPRAGVGISGEAVHDMRPFLRNLAVHQQRWNSVEDSHGSIVNNVNCGVSDDNDSGLFAVKKLIEFRR